MYRAEMIRVDDGYRVLFIEIDTSLVVLTGPIRRGREAAARAALAALREMLKVATSLLN